MRLWLARLVCPGGYRVERGLVRRLPIGGTFTYTRASGGTVLVAGLGRRVV